MLDNRDLRRVYKNSIYEKKFYSIKKCPTFSQLLKVARLDMKDKKRNKIINHITNCSSCAENTKFILGLLKYEKQITREVSKLVSPKEEMNFNSNFNLSKLAYFLKKRFKYAATVLGIIVLVFSLIEYIIKPKQINLRGNEVKKIELIEPKGKTKINPPMVIKWKTLLYADYFICEIFNENLILIWRSERIKCCESEIPNHIFSIIKIDKPYYCMITAYTEEEIEIETNLVEFKRYR